MRRKVLAGALFLGSLLLLSLAATPYSRAADAALVSARLTLLIVLSVLVVRERWGNRHGLPGKSAPSDPDVGDRFLQGCRRWYHGE
jgi:hypothetical protein